MAAITEAAAEAAARLPQAIRRQQNRCGTAVKIAAAAGSPLPSQPQLKRACLNKLARARLRFFLGRRHSPAPEAFAAGGVAVPPKWGCMIYRGHIYIPSTPPASRRQRADANIFQPEAEVVQVL